jgi:hypothetical protein
MLKVYALYLFLQVIIAVGEEALLLKTSMYPTSFLHTKALHAIYNLICSLLETTHLENVWFCID